MRSMAQSRPYRASPGQTPSGSQPFSPMVPAGYDCRRNHRRHLRARARCQEHGTTSQNVIAYMRVIAGCPQEVLRAPAGVGSGGRWLSPWTLRYNAYLCKTPGRMAMARPASGDVLTALPAPKSSARPACGFRPGESDSLLRRVGGLASTPSRRDDPGRSRCAIGCIGLHRQPHGREGPSLGHRGADHEQGSMYRGWTGDGGACRARSAIRTAGR